MRSWIAASTFAAVFLTVSALGPDTSPAMARQKPGPITLRGVARHVSGSGFLLVTNTHGTLTVRLSPATSITRKGSSGRATVREGSHVGVRGFLQGTTIRAIRVRIYPIKPKPYSVRGRVAATGSALIIVTASGSRMTIRLTGGTVIHVGRNVTGAGAIRVGDRVEARVLQTGGGITAQRVHVFRRKPVRRHVQIVGSVAQVGAGTIWVRSGGSVTRVRVPGGVAVYLGNATTSAGAIRPGQVVRVYACCAGGSLTATSIHIRKIRTVRHMVLLRGRVVFISGGQLRLQTTAGPLTVILGRGTSYELGTQPIEASGILAGDQVSVRAYRSGSGWIGQRVHVYVAGRRPHTISGTVTYVGNGFVMVRAAGRIYTVRPAQRARVSLAGRGVGLGTLRLGDRVRAVGRLTGRTLAASSIAARRLPVKLRTLHGSVVTIAGSTIVIVDSLGTRHRLTLAPGARVQMNGRPASLGGFFPGLRITAKGRLTGSNMVASRIVASATTRAVKGVIVVAGRQSITVRSSGGRQVVVNIPPTARIRDGGRRLSASSLQAGGRVQILGFATPTGVRAQSVTVLHPAVDLRGTLATGRSAPAIHTTAGATIRLHFTPASSVSTGTAAVTLVPSQIPSGARIHVRGTVQSDGSVLVSAISVRLAAVTLRGQIASMAGVTWSVRAAGSVEVVRLTARTAVVQGTHPLGVGELVIGDDVTVYGYRLGSAVIARKVAVHRRLVGLDGTVSSPTSAGFMLATTSGSVRVIVPASTLISGTVAEGATVHVTGYRRGDGAVLATRVRVKAKRKKPSAATHLS